jgi:H+/Na+-translocating ferredoxin:NAD+ oxidoreductase subunit B
MADEKDTDLTRRDVLKLCTRCATVVVLGGGVAALTVRNAKTDDMVWQIDPTKCIDCGNCATTCVIEPSAVRCVHAIKICGYCEPCFGYFDRSAVDKHEGAENQMCPTGAINRKHVTGPFYEYTIDAAKCIGCGKCTKGCKQYGNGSLYLQVDHGECVNCSQCAIAEACPSQAFVRVPARDAYISLYTKPEPKD